MKKFKIIVQFEMISEVEVEAETAEDALDCVYDVPIPTLLSKAEYVTGSRLPWDNCVVEVVDKHDEV